MKYEEEPEKSQRMRPSRVEVLQAREAKKSKAQAKKQKAKQKRLEDESYDGPVCGVPCVWDGACWRLGVAAPAK